ncbi:hypothetical protein [Burkholderia dolosa]|uniref:Uncharacterized protein n=1 Tax=Burkholderia dolosa TaxID=152500 RepID=A0A892IF80_9BURK|nr:hypothetical protein [Burkholderia dolosa]MBY4940188.1 hypothetical protein [Burkholderia dolosa]MCC5027919.1 hypothetical protein [Burkholderia dolosa]QRO79490.1 hypothetical protein I6K02_23410 [Burkholderia dolosa]UAK66180.1 hypothetical protein K8O94_18810 [Burkholderia dolosa]
MLHPYDDGARRFIPSRMRISFAASRAGSASVANAGAGRFRARPNRPSIALSSIRQQA